jgi:hypothetical protein
MGRSYGGQAVRSHTPPATEENLEGQMSDRVRRWWATALSVATMFAAFALAFAPLMRRW